MIDWLVQSAKHYSDLIDGRVPQGLLSAAEQARLAALKTGKRRHDWLLGRWTAKHLVQSCLEREMGVRLPLDKLTVGNEPGGAPFVEWCVPNASMQRLALHLSISHSNEHAFCALLSSVGQAGSFVRGLGADIERVEPRSLGFVQDYLTAVEIAQVRQAPDDLRDVVLTALWSAKESVLKALHRGLTVDTRRIACVLDRPVQPAPRWQSLDIQCDPGLAPGQEVRGWWRSLDDRPYVLTLAIIDDA